MNNRSSQLSASAVPDAMTNASLLRLVRPLWAARIPGAAAVTADFRNAVPDLNIPPLIPGDRDAAHTLYRGEFCFAGARVVAGAGGVFAETPPNHAWWKTLHSFAWIGDLLGSGSELHRAHARAQLQAWFAASRRGPSNDTSVTARRLTTIAQHWPELLRGASMAFTQDLARIASRDTAHLRAGLPKTLGSLNGVTSALALARVGQSFRNFEGLKAFALSRLAGELDRFILPDGGPLTRNAGDLADLLADLVPLRDAMALARREVPRAIHAAIERSMPMLRFFAHGDGGLALFQGVATPRVRLVKALLDRDTVVGRPFLHAYHSGFARLQYGTATLIMDVKAGPLATAPFAFEFSEGAQRIVVNCGFPHDENPHWIRACCGTAAHSAVVLGGEEPGKSKSFRLSSLLRRKEVDYPGSAADAHATAEGGVLCGEYHGYVDAFNLVHRRSVYLSASGQDVRGEDSFVAANASWRNPQDVPFVIRFHLHPAIRAIPSQDGHGCLLLLPNKSGWQFSSRGGTLSLEDSVYLAGEGGPRQTTQIVIRGMTAGPFRANWTFKSVGRRPKKNSGKDDAPELPF